MSRLAFALLLAGLTAFAASRVEPPYAAAQDKKKDKKKTTAPEPAGDVEEDLSRVLPVFDPGSHTQGISAMGFTKDKTKLVTVGEDFTVQVWNASTGERLEVLRLPGYGREKGYDPGRWDVAAVSPDGTRVALGGQRKFFTEVEGKTKTVSQALLVEVPTRRVVRLEVALNTSGPGDVTALAFSPDGDRLAVAVDKQGKDNYQLQVIGGLTDRIRKSTAGVRTNDCKPVRTPHTGSQTSLAFSPDGKHLLLGGDDQRLTTWDIPAGIAPVPKLAKEIAVEGDTHSLAWSPDGKQFARAADGTTKSDLRAIELWTADGSRDKVWKADDLNAVFTARAGKIFTVTFLDAKTLYFVANGPAEKKDGGASLAGTIDIATGKDRRVAAVSDGMLKEPCGCASADGSLVAVTVMGNTEVVVSPLAGGQRVWCGVQNQLPHHVGWSKDPAKPGFAWTDERHSGKAEPTSAVLTFGFDLTKVEPAGAIKGADYLPASRKLGEWTLEFPGKKADAADEGKGLAQLKQGGKFVHGFAGAKGIGHTLVANGDKPPLVAFANHIDGQGDRAAIHTAEGRAVVRLLPQFTRIHDMAASPDGRFLIATTGTPRVVVYRTDGSPYPFLSFAQLNGEWVLWTPEGYYAASPGGEKLFGWAVNNGPNELVTFHQAEKFAKQFRRPDVIKLAIEKGSVKDALAAVNAVVPEVERILPPSAKLMVVEQRGSVVKVRAEASSGVKDKPVTTMRVLLDGRPLPDGKGAWTPVPGEAMVEFEIPGGMHELKVLARSEDGAAVSEPVVVKAPQRPDSQPTLHRVCIGVNEYDDAGLRLGSAAKDAAAVFAALGKECVGTANRFGAAKGEQLLDKDATRERALKALSDARRAAKGGDLLVVFFAGHGVRQGEEFYLLTREADVTKDLAGKSLSGADLRKALAEVECPVLLLIDACHSAAAVRTFRPATDDLTRALTDDAVGVTVMSASMAHETAGATEANGLFTAGLLKGLRAGDGVPFDPYERQVYVHHLYSVAFSEVRRATGGRQNPFLNMPWTAPPLAVREVPLK